MVSAPEIIAVTAAREVTDRARAMEELTDKRSLGERLLFGSLIFAVSVSPIILERLGVARAGDLELNVIIAFEFAALTALILAAEIYRLRRRVKALTYLVLQRERKSNEP